MEVLTKRSYIQIFLYAIFLAFLAAAIIFVFAGFQGAEARITVSPTRLVLEEGERSETIHLINTAEEETTYRIFLEQRKMTEEGDLERVDPPQTREERLQSGMAKDLIQYSPRQVTLPPDQEQAVNLQVRYPADLEEGEYRTRIIFQEIPEAEEDVEELEEEEIQIQLRTVYGVSLPLIVRRGDLQADVELTGFELQESDEEYELALTIERSGGRSVYGDVKVELLSSDSENEKIGEREGVAVYEEVDERQVSIPLETEIPEEGVVEITYTDSEGRIKAETEWPE